MSARAPTLDRPISPSGERRRHVLRPRPVLVVACIAAATWFVYDARPADHTIGAKFGFTGVPESYVVPAGICRIRIEAVGAAGGGEGPAGAPGSGARAIARLGVAPGEILRVRVGGLGGAGVGTSPGNGGWNGGGAGGVAADGAAGHHGKAGSGGGGATDVRIGGDGLEHRVVVAGGGSGGAGGGIGGSNGTGGGDGGAPIGGAGLAALGTANPATGGRGGMQVAGGSPGRNAPDLSITATAGSLGVGGSGAAGGVSGGGGGGFFGGGGGGSELKWASGYFGEGYGGGGSSFGPAGTTLSAGIEAGFGWATISYDRENDACRTTPRKGDPAAPADRERGYATLQTGEMPEQWNSGIRDHTAEAAHPVPAKPSSAAVTAFYRRAAERTARLMGKPAPKWKLCPSCKLAFHGPDTVPENSATGHTPGDWQP